MFVVYKLPCLVVGFFVWVSTLVVLPLNFCSVIRLPFFLVLISHCHVPSRVIYVFFRRRNKYWSWDCALYWCCAGKLFIVVSTMFRRLTSNFIALCADVSVVSFTESVSLTTVVTIVATGARGVHCYRPTYAFDQYISRYVLRLDTHRFAVVTIARTLTVKVGNQLCGSAYAGWTWRGSNETVVTLQMIISMRLLRTCHLCVLLRSGLQSKVK